ncbi:MAG: hypothetical protein H7834_15270, partial [Magnetococcus sp. YQC-9]
AKNALRAAFVSVVSAFWKRRSHLARSLAKNYASQSRCGLKEVFFAFFAKNAPRASQGLRDCFAPFAKQSREHGPRTKLRARGFKVW